MESMVNKVEVFKELLDMTHKGFIDSKYIESGREPPVPLSLKPLAYEDDKVQKGLNQLRHGASNAIIALDKFTETK